MIPKNCQPLREKFGRAVTVAALCGLRFFGCGGSARQYLLRSKTATLRATLHCLLLQDCGVGADSGQAVLGLIERQEAVVDFQTHGTKGR